MPRYLVVRTDKRQTAFIARELEAGRLRQGWGWKPEQDLRLIRLKLNEGGKLTAVEVAAWRNRRLLDTERDGLKLGDIIIVPNLPVQGSWLIGRVAGPYRYEQPSPEAGVGNDYAHIVPVELVKDTTGRPAAVEADNLHVDARLRASMRSMSRMWSIDVYGDKIEKIIGAIGEGKNTSSPQPEEHKFRQLSAEITEAAWNGIRARYKGAELEKLVMRVLKEIYPNIEHRGGPAEQGADLIALTKDRLGLEYKVAVQVKLHEGEENDIHSLAQIKRAREAHGIDAGIVLTTATSLSEGYSSRRDELETELGIDIRVIRRNEFVRLLLAHLGTPTEEE